VLIVGGGMGGMSAAISMRRAGMEVDLAEIDPNWKIYGAGITITGPTLRALKTLGVLDQVKGAGRDLEWCLYLHPQRPADPGAQQLIQFDLALRERVGAQLELVFQSRQLPVGLRAGGLRGLDGHCQRPLPQSFSQVGHSRREPA
jgi:2-polyprenyl-6-methoxyphenol hydroxylase-like FAD-dependent oxidoreductase